MEPAHQLQKTGESSTDPTSAAVNTADVQQTIPPDLLLRFYRQTANMATMKAIQFNGHTQSIQQAVADLHPKKQQNTDTIPDGCASQVKLAETSSSGTSREDPVDLTIDSEDPVDVMSDSEDSIDLTSGSEVPESKVKPALNRKRNIGWYEFEFNHEPVFRRRRPDLSFPAQAQATERYAEPPPPGYPAFITVDLDDDGYEDDNSVLNTFAFTVEFLQNSFNFFESALNFDQQSGRVYAKGEARHFTFDNITLQGFFGLLDWVNIYSCLTSWGCRWPLTGTRMAGRNYKAQPINALLETVLAADYLGIGDFKAFEQHIAERLAYALVMNRLQLTHAVLVLVKHHSAFRSGLLWDVCVKAAVRPDLQQIPDFFWTRVWHRRHADGFAIEYLGSDYTWEETWGLVRQHYTELREQCPWYDEEVKKAVAETVRNEMIPRWVWERRRSRSWESEYEDPLFRFMQLVRPALPRPWFRSYLGPDGVRGAAHSCRNCPKGYEGHDTGRTFDSTGVLIRDPDNEYYIDDPFHSPYTDSPMDIEFIPF